MREAPCIAVAGTADEPATGACCSVDWGGVARGAAENEGLKWLESDVRDGWRRSKALLGLACEGRGRAAWLSVWLCADGPKSTVCEAGIAPRLSRELVLVAGGLGLDAGKGLVLGRPTGSGVKKLASPQGATGTCIGMAPRLGLPDRASRLVASLVSRAARVSLRARLRFA